MRPPSKTTIPVENKPGAPMTFPGIASPTFDRARTLRLTLACSIASTLIVGLVVVPGSRDPVLNLAILLALDFAFLFAFRIARAGRVRFAATLYLSAIWLGMTVAAVLVHGKISSPALESYLLVVLLAGLLLGMKATLAYAGLSALSLTFLFLAEIHHLLPASPDASNPLRIYFFDVGYLILAGALAYISMNSIRKAFVQARQHQADLQESNRKLNEIRNSLEHTIADRTSEILQQKQFFESLVKHNPLAIVILDKEHRVISCNPAFEALFGYAPEEVARLNLDDFIVDDRHHDEALAYTRKALSGETIRSTGVRRKKDGSLVEVDIFGVPVLVAGERIGVLAMYDDITERVRTEHALQSAKERAELLYRLTPSSIFAVDKERRITAVNAQFAQATGYKPEEMIGRPCTTFALGNCLTSCGLYDANVPKPIFGAECRIMTKGGQERFVLKNAELLRDDDGNVIGGIESFEDISERVAAEAILKHQATHDSLTDLPNRVLFSDRLRHAIDLAKRSGPMVAVMFMDLDGFKEINDIYGHEIGDSLLRSLATRLKNEMRRSDTVARLGGDEFSLVCEQIYERQDAATIADKIRGIFSRPFIIGDKKIYISASLGISLYPYDGDSVTRLLQAADAAMYCAKRDGKNSFRFFDCNCAEE